MTNNHKPCSFRVEMKDTMHSTLKFFDIKSKRTLCFFNLLMEDEALSTTKLREKSVYFILSRYHWIKYPVSMSHVLS